MSMVVHAPAAMAVDDAEDDQLASTSMEDIIRASRLLENEIRVHKAVKMQLCCSQPSRTFPGWKDRTRQMRKHLRIIPNK